MSSGFRTGRLSLLLCATIAFVTGKSLKSLRILLLISRNQWLKVRIIYITYTRIHRWGLVMAQAVVDVIKTMECHERMG